MTPGRASRKPQRRAGALQSAGNGTVVALDGARIARALRTRERYRYVQPRIERLGAGWKVVSPNCSRNVDTSGGDIDIAWLEPTIGGHWIVHLRDHEAHAWLPKAVMFTLPAALDLVCHDPDREFWP